MKNLILLFFLSLSLISISCTAEHDEPIASDESYTNIEIQIPDLDEIKTRAFSDGLSINNLKCYVYDRSKPAESAPVLIETIPMHNYSGHMGAYYSLYLPKFATYDLVLLATSCPQDNNTGKIYYSQTARTINVNYDAATPNDESLDCFWGVITNVNPDNSSSYSVTLKRPFAQLNIGTKDLTAYNEMASSSLQSVAVGINGVYTSMNAMDGKVSGKTNLSFPASSIPTGQTFPVSGNDYLSMNYLLVNERTNVDVSMNVKNQTKSFDCAFNTIPLQRNYRTNIYGNLLTGSNDYKVEIEPDYTGREDKEFDLYDLVFKVEDGTTNISLYYTTSDSDNLKEIDLSNYIDSNNTVKVSWEGLGISNATSIRFVEKPSIQNNVNYYKVPITEFRKFDIDKFEITSFYGTFAGCCYVKDFSFINNWDTSHSSNMSRMFWHCKSITTFDLHNFITKKVTDMSFMFSGCESLTYLDISDFDTSVVTNMYAMFADCRSLTYLDISNFDTRNVLDMGYLFNFCKKLDSLIISTIISNLDTSCVKSMQNMFGYCECLSYLDLSSFDTRNVTDMSGMFEGCESLNYLDLSSFDTRNVTNTYDMFARCNASVIWGPNGGV